MFSASLRGCAYPRNWNSKRFARALLYKQRSFRILYSLSFKSRNGGEFFQNVIFGKEAGLSADLLDDGSRVDRAPGESGWKVLSERDCCSCSRSEGISGAGPL